MKAGTEALQDPIGLNQHAPKGMRRCAIVGAWQVFRERDRMGELTRHLVDVDGDSEFLQHATDTLIELGD